MRFDDIIKTESKKDYFQKLMTFIDTEYQSKVIFPRKEDIYNAFHLTPFENVKVVILGQDPYHDHGQAHGLAFSVKENIKIPPSLRNIYSELLDDIGVMPPNHGNLTSWAKEGVLLLNTILTVEAHKPLSHKNKGWEAFTDKVIKELNNDARPKVFVLWGNNAMKKKELITNVNHLIIESSHPSPLSARHSFFGSKVFSRINTFLKETNQEEIDFTINW